MITPKKIDGDYIYCFDSIFKRFTRFFWYRIIATPLAFLYTKVKFGHKVIGRDKLKGFEKKGYFIYGNHTQDIGDALIPSMINFPKSNYCIVHPNNVSMTILGKITPSLGAIPLPDDMNAYKNFTRAIERRFKEGNAIVIYPEAHIWPYYTKIRNFSDVSFQYPVKLDSPVFSFVNTYQKRKLRREPRIVTYIEGPFYPNKTLSLREQRKDLRDRVFASMTENAKKSDIVMIEYRKREEK